MAVNFVYSDFYSVFAGCLWNANEEPLEEFSTWYIKKYKTIIEFGFSKFVFILNLIFYFNFFKLK